MYEYTADMVYMGDNDDYDDDGTLQEDTKIVEPSKLHAEVDEDAELQALFDDINVSCCGALNKSQASDVDDQNSFMPLSNTRNVLSETEKHYIIPDSAQKATPNKQNSIPSWTFPRF